MNEWKEARGGGVASGVGGEQSKAKLEIDY